VLDPQEDDMDRKTTTRPKSRQLTRSLAVFAVVVGAGLITAAPARAEHWHHHGGFFFGLPFLPIPIPIPVPVVVAPRYYEPPVYYRDPPVRYERPYYGGHGRHRDGRDRRDERYEWTHSRHHHDWDRGDD
jgi:hypothetical protein